MTGADKENDRRMFGLVTGKLQSIDSQMVEVVEILRKIATTLDIEDQLLQDDPDDWSAEEGEVISENISLEDVQKAYVVEEELHKNMLAGLDNAFKEHGPFDVRLVLLIYQNRLLTSLGEILKGKPLSTEELQNFPKLLHEAWEKAKSEEVVPRVEELSQVGIVAEVASVVQQVLRDNQLEELFQVGIVAEVGPSCRSLQ